MLVYGDAKRVEDPREKIAGMRAGLERLVTARPQIERRAILAELLVEAGELGRGLLDQQLALFGDGRPARGGGGGLRR